MRCFLLGGGQSLAGFDFHRLDSEITIGANVIYKFYVPTILVWEDVNLYLHRKEEIDKLTCIKYTRECWIQPSYKNVSGYKKAWQFFGSEGLTKGLFGGKRSYMTGVVMISLAVSLGYSPIYLLGYDGGMVGGRLHFHNEYDKEKREAAFLNANVSYDEFTGCEIYNCSLESKITQFPKISIAEVFRDNGL